MPNDAQSSSLSSREYVSDSANSAYSDVNSCVPSLGGDPRLATTHRVPFAAWLLS